ncbi:MAG: HAD family hydrolase [Candidatus Promineifilaceae bacterium]
MNIFTCKAIIFDLDGVLVDSSAVVEKHWQNWADCHNLDMAQILPILHGRRAVEVMQLVAPHLNVQVEAAQLSAVEAAETDGLIPVDGAKSLLQALPPKAWGVATSGTRNIATARLRASSLPLPEVLVTADDVQYGKPAPDAYLLAAQKLGVAPENCLVFEDAPAGIEAAVNAGMHVVALTTSHKYEELLHANRIIENLSVVEVVVNDSDSPNRTLQFRI